MAVSVISFPTKGLPKRGAANEQRDPFKPDELSKLLASDLPGHLHWLTWLGLCTGARLNELAQLAAGHVEIITSSTTFISGRTCASSTRLACALCRCTTNCLSWDFSTTLAARRDCYSRAWFNIPQAGSPTPSQGLSTASRKNRREAAKAQFSQSQAHLHSRNEAYGAG